jgi:glucose/arabinose dehydrogenase
MSEQNNSAPEQNAPSQEGSETPRDDVPARHWHPSRRRILQGAAAAGGLAALGAHGQAQEETESIELGGVTSGWVGRAPEEIAEEENPTLQLTEGQTYELTWENVDGLPHNVVIIDGDGNELERTEIVSGEGETQTLEFEASSEMAQYLCEVHPNTMRGSIEVGDGGGQEETEEQAAAFFEEGAEIGVQTVAEGMTAPTDFAVAGGDDDRYFVTDQTGEIWVVDGENGRQDEPFLDLSEQMVELGEFNGQYADQDQDYDERGVLGIALHPQFSENGRFYVNYSVPPNEETPEDWDHVQVISEFTAEDGESATPDSERVLVEFQKPQYNHNSGPIAFGPDDYLYVPMGDGGGANDDMYGHVDDWYDENGGGNGQDVTENRLGGVHRLDVDFQNEDCEYGVPQDNPLVDEENAHSEYYAWGFRDPYGISFDSQDRLFVADAGQDLFEEANIVESGGNYGWNVKEGTHCFSTDSPGDPPEDCPDTAPDEAPYNGQELLDPFVEYPHIYEGQTVGIVIVGGHVYEAGDVADLDGKYIFGDWANDPAREEPAGRLFAATEPDDSGDVSDSDGDTAAADDDSNGNATASDDSDGNVTASNDSNGNVTASGDSDGNATADNESDGGGASEDGEEQVVPRDELWDMEELMVANSDDGSLGHFVRMFGQDDDGGVYILANREGTPTGDTGVVMEIVPPEEGEGPPGTGTDEEEVADEASEKGEDETAGNETDASTNETTGETDDNVSAGNESTDTEGDNST